MMKKKRFTAMMLTAIMLTSFLAGCGSGSSPETSAGDAQTEQTQGQTDAAAEGEDLTFTFAISTEPSYLDPAIAYNSETAILVEQLYWPMFSYDENGNIVNEACEEYEVSDDGLVYTFHLTDENYWSDGKPCVAGDYAYGMKHNIGYGPDASFAYFLYDHIAGAQEAHDAMADTSDMENVGIRVIDDYTLEITLASPCPFFVGLMTDSMAYPLRSDYVVDRESTWAYDPAVPTNGPFHPVSINEAEEIVMEKNPYFAKADEVQITTLVAKVIKDSQAQLAAFETGEIDMARSLPSDAAVSYLGSDELKIISPLVSASFIWVNMSGNTNPALQDVRVRQALSYAIDRDYLLEMIGNEAGLYYPLYGIIPKGIAGVNGDFREEADADHHLADYDLDKAIELLNEAGYNESNPLTIEYLYNQSTKNEDVAVALQAMWEKAGIQTELRVVEQKAYAADRRAGEYQVARGGTSANYLDPSFYLIRHTIANQSYPATDDPEYDKLLEEKDSILDPKERLEGLHEVEQYLVEDQMYIIPLYGSSTPILLNAKWDGLGHDPADRYHLDTLHLK